VLRAVKPAVLLPTTTLNFVTPYHLYDRVVRLMEAHYGQVLDMEFLEDVTVTVRLKDEEVDSFTSQLNHLSAGRVEAVVVDQNPESVFPL